MKCLIVSNGDIKNYEFYNEVLKEVDFIICADGGAKHLYNLDIVPDMVIGDLDSINYKLKEIYKAQGVKFVEFPTNKDATDTELATDLAIAQNATEIIYIGTIGSRMDHTIANIALLKKVIENGIKSYIINENNKIYLIKDSIEIAGQIGDYLSIIPITPIVKGVTLRGLKYSLSNAEIIFGSSLGISNEFVENKVIIQIDEGLLLVIKSRD